MISSDVFYLDWFIPPIIFASIIQIALYTLKVGNYKLYFLGIFPFFLNIILTALLLAFSFYIFPDTGAINMSFAYGKKLTYFTYVSGYFLNIAIVGGVEQLKPIILWVQNIGFLIISISLSYQITENQYKIRLNFIKKILITLSVLLMYFVMFFVFYIFDLSNQFFVKSEMSIWLVCFALAKYYFWFQIYWNVSIENMPLKLHFIVVILLFSTFEIINCYFYDGSLYSVLVSLLTAVVFYFIRLIWGAVIIIAIIFFSSIYTFL